MNQWLILVFGKSNRLWHSSKYITKQCKPEVSNGANRRPHRYNSFRRFHRHNRQLHHTLSRIWCTVDVLGNRSRGNGTEKTSFRICRVARHSSRHIHWYHYTMRKWLYIRFWTGIPLQSRSKRIWRYVLGNCSLFHRFGPNNRRNRHIPSLSPLCMLVSHLQNSAWFWKYCNHCIMWSLLWKFLWHHKIQGFRVLLEILPIGRGMQFTLKFRKNLPWLLLNSVLTYWVNVSVLRQKNSKKWSICVLIFFS